MERILPEKSDQGAGSPPLVIFFTTGTTHRIGSLTAKKGTTQMNNYSIDTEELKKFISPESYFSSRLGSARDSKNGKEIRFCQFHPDQNTPNFEATVTGQYTGTCKCWAGCLINGKETADIIDLEMELYGLSFYDAKVKLAREYASHLLKDDPPRSKTYKEKPPDQEWNYTDKDGKLVHLSRRFYKKVEGGYKKSYAQSHVNEDGEIVDGLPSTVKRVLYNLPALTADKDSIIYLTEGEKCADILVKNGLLATCCAGGAGGWLDYYKEELIARRVVVLEDNNQPGRKYGKAVAESLHGTADKIKIVRFLELPEGDDIYDFLQSNSIDDLVKKRNKADAFMGSYSDYFGDDPGGDGDGPESEEDESWDDPKPLVAELDEVLSFPIDLLPLSLKGFIKDAAHRMQCPIDYMGVSMLSFCGAIIGTRCGLQPKAKDSSWKVISNLWGGVVGAPSSLKSPAISEGMKPLGRLEFNAKEIFEKEMAEYNADLIEYEAEKETLSKKIKKLAGQSGKSKAMSEAKQALIDLEKPLKPSMRRYKTNDATHEKLGILENSNPTGILLFKDELVGLLSSWEKPGREDARAFFLEGWNGTDSYLVDRVGREDLHIPFHCLTVFGGIQPSKLMAYLLKAMHGLDNDGLLQRFQLLVYPDELPEFQNVDQYPDKEARDQAYNTIFKLAEMDFREYGAVQHDEYDKFPYVKFSPEAQTLFNEWRIELEGKLRREYKEAHPIMAEHFGKYRSLMPALALLFHWLDVAQKIVNGETVNTGVGVSAQCAVNAAAFCEYLESHAHRIYGLVLKSEKRAAMALADKIKDGVFENGFTIRDVMRKGGHILNISSKVAQDACDTAEDHNIIRARATISGWQQKPITRYDINPKFKRQADGKME